MNPHCNIYYSNQTKTSTYSEMLIVFDDLLLIFLLNEITYQTCRI